MSSSEELLTYDCVIIGGGYTGLSAAFELVRSGYRVVVYEADSQVGGLAGSFDVGGVQLEKFYHHWFTSDTHISDLVEDLGQTENIVYRPTNTGMYYANRVYRLSTPWDLLKFSPLKFLDRLRMAKVAIAARRISDWQELENVTAEKWLRRICGDQVFDKIWGPLLIGKFGPYANDVSAVWMWNKLKLRGGSRSKGGAENLAYFRGGFAALSKRLAERIVELGGEVHTSTPVQEVIIEGKKVTGVRTSRGVVNTHSVIATPALPLIDRLVGEHLNDAELAKIRSISYLANTCLVLQLDRSLSQTYWLNVTDPDFPYVGVIEHTNFEPSGTYNGRHIVYLSKYLPESADLFRMTDDEVLKFSIPHLKRMFPNFDEKWILASNVWKARYSQPIVTLHYSKSIPDSKTSVDGLYIETMAQVYPEDRGTNYAVRNGRRIGRELVDVLNKEKQIVAAQV